MAHGWHAVAKPALQCMLANARATPSSFVSEKEVLFQSGSKFKVIDQHDVDAKIAITLHEVL